MPSPRRITGPKDKVLLVEGPDDQHVVWNLLDSHGIHEGVSVIDLEGYPNIHADLPRRLKFANERVIGVMVDADVDFDGRWTSLRDVIVRAGYSDVPDMPTTTGVIVEEADKPKIGVWIMPDNQSVGMLEDFAKLLMPPDDVLWRRAVEAVSSLPKEVRLFSELHLAKAHIHTWLAWQEQPGHPIGRSIKIGDLDRKLPQALPSSIGWYRCSISSPDLELALTPTPSQFHYQNWLYNVVRLCVATDAVLPKREGTLTMPKALLTCDQLIKQAYLSIMRRQTDFARSLLERALAIEPDNTEALNLLAGLPGGDAILKATVDGDDGPASSWLGGTPVVLAAPQVLEAVAPGAVRSGVAARTESGAGASPSPAVMMSTGTAILVAQAQRAISVRQYQQAIDLLQSVIEKERVAAGGTLAQAPPVNPIDKTIATVKAAGPVGLFYGGLKLVACMLVGVLVFWVSVPNPSDTSLTASLAELLGVDENTGVGLGMLAGAAFFAAFVLLKIKRS